MKDSTSKLGDEFGKQDESVPPLLRAKQVHALRNQLINLIADSTVQHEMKILRTLVPEANYELVKTIMNHVLPKSSMLQQSWTKEVMGMRTKDKLANKWSNPLKVVTTWIINKLIVRQQDRIECKDAALREKDQIGAKRLSPQETADIVLELRDIVVALGFGSQLNIPTVGAAIESTLSDFVKLQLTNWNSSRGKTKRARLGQLPENYSEANLKKLVEKAQEFYVATAVTARTRSMSRDFGSRMRTRSQAVLRHIREESDGVTGGTPLIDPEDESPKGDEPGSDSDESSGGNQRARVNALQSPVGHTGPTTTQKGLRQQVYGRAKTTWPNRAYRQGTPGPARVERSGESAFPVVPAKAILGAPDYDGCWWCESPHHYQRDCPEPGASTAPKRPQGLAPRQSTGSKVLSSLQEVEQMVDILHNQQLAQVVAIQGVSPAFQDQLPPESVAAIQQYEESPYAEVYRRTAEGAYGHSDQY